MASSPAARRRPARPTAATVPSPATVRDKLARIRTALEDVAVERDREIGAALACLVAGEHLCLVGPPGLAKSFVLNSLMACFDGEVRRYETTMNKMTTDVEVFGPLSVADLINPEATTYRRLTEGYLPDAHFAFLDEIWKGNGAVLNSILNVLNERVYLMGRVSVPCPLVMAVAASNEWPTDPESASNLMAVFDRLLVRMTVRPVQREDSLARLLFGGQDRKVKVPCFLTLEDVSSARGEVLEMSLQPRWEADAADCFNEVVYQVRREGLCQGDRRLMKSVKMCAAAAYVAGRDQVSREDLGILAHVLWTDPVEHPARVAKIVSDVARPASMVVDDWAVQAEDALSGVRRRDLATAAEANAKLTVLLDRMRSSGDVISRAGKKAADMIAYVEKRQADLLRLASSAMGFRAPEAPK